jgi:capsular exopolysaccharide synthesis family protein
MSPNTPSWPLERTGNEVAVPPAVDPGIAPRMQYAPDLPPDPPGDLHRTLIAAVRRKWLVLIITLLGTAAGAVGSRFLDPRYAARAVLWIEAAGRAPPREGGSMVDEVLVQTPSWGELVTSGAVLEDVVRSLHLYVSPESPADRSALAGFGLGRMVRPGKYELFVEPGARYRLVDENGAVVDRGAVGDSVGRPVGFAWVPAAAALPEGRRIKFEVSTPYDATEALMKRIRIRQDPGGSFLRIELKGTDPALTAQTVNAVAERTVTLAADLKQRKFAELTKILGEQYQQAQQSVSAAENALAAFRVRTAGVVQQGAPVVSPSLDIKGDPLFARAYELRFNVEQLERERRVIDKVLGDVPRSGLKVEALAVLPSVQQSPELNNALAEVTQKEAELRALRSRYTDQSAPVLQAKADLDSLERSAVPALAQKLAANLAAREAAFKPEMDSAYGYMRRVPPIALEEDRLKRELAGAEALFGTVSQRYEAARLALISSSSDVRLLDGAVQPGRPSLDFGPVVIALAFLTSLALGLFAAVMLDRADPRVRTPEQVIRGMRLPILAALPHVSLRQAPGASLRSAEVIEALRGLRVRVLHTQGTDGPLLLTVTSPSVGDGKSFVSVNLALSFAYAGYKTLLIDGDVRRGAQHRVLEAESEPGLTDVLAGYTVAESAVQQTGYPNLWFLSCGTRMYRSPELLLMPRLKEIVARFRSAYQIIIVDSPPLVAGIDPLVLATITGNLLVVLRSEATDRELATAKLQVADTLPVRMIGAVLNCVRGDGAFKYYTYDLEGYAEAEAVTAGGRREGWRHILGGRSS